MPKKPPHPPEEDNVENVAEHAGRYARKVIEEVSHAPETADSFITAIRDEPVKSALIALGAGILIGMIIRR